MKTTSENENLFFSYIRNRIFKNKKTDENKR